MNELACKRLGYTRDEYLSMDPARMDAPEMDVDIPASMDRLREQSRETIELVHMAKDGTRIPVEVSSHLFKVRGRTRHLAIVRDIRERKRADERLRASLREKEVLLQEIHHRVKNNLQLVSSMISLHGEELGEGITTELQTRVRAMALVHEVLYGMNDLSRIRFDEYISTLIEELRHIYDDGGNTLVSLDLDEISLPIETAVPLGLLANEIVSNAFKHAHPQGEPGRLDVRLSDEDRVELFIADDGVGLPASAHSDDSLGIVLIAELSGQLGAELEVSRNPGTAYIVRVPRTAEARAQGPGAPSPGRNEGASL